ncbi:hypothetical protein [Geotalea uraniireducens]|uniref:Uncharacterized protein n=1 Tax=Geotalea uraniireducens (strain Rf4) TaxID=351605 RepID=A5G9N3_GEOUR|nr:hypothetical protein [Geotalea uraniireducens]ABQ28501.1 hypothetical protein Gura_4358 [Geotalea uraniireducens Rf4]
MSQNLADLMPVDGASVNIRTWLKSFSYTKRLLVGESGDPWESASRYLAYFSQAQGLLKPDVAVIEVGELFDAWLQRNPAVKAELAGKRKLSYPLRKLLEQSQPRELLAEIIEAVLAQLRGQLPLVLSMPSPGSWLQKASRAAGRGEVELDGDSIEDSAMYVADLARSVSGAAVGGLLLEESLAGVQPGGVDPELYRPLINLARHYRWPLALRMGEGKVVDSPALAEIDVFIGAGDFPAAGRAQGLDVSGMVWGGEPLPPLTPTQFYFVDIPRDALPEQVLDSLARLKADRA